MKRPRWSLSQAAGTLTALLLVGFLLVPMPYVTTAPGVTQDVLGEMNDVDGEGHPVIQIYGTKTYPTSGKLLLTTVGVYGSRETPLAMLNVLAGWLSPSRQVAPMELYYPPTTTRDEVREINLAEMASSQNTAAVAALTELGHDVPVVLQVVGTVTRDMAGLPEDESVPRATDVLVEGDVLESVAGHDIKTYAQLLDIVAQLVPDEPIDVTVLRDGDEVVVQFAPYTDLTAAAREADSDDSDGDGDSQADERDATRLGVLLDNDYDMPFDITINAEQVGGPSAGLMFALGIIDQLSPEDLTGGLTVAGTGTIDVDGSVGAIGGIDHKLRGAAEAEAAWFLAPSDNCADITRIPNGLEVVAVSSLKVANAALADIVSGDTASLPRCPGS